MEVWVDNNNIMLLLNVYIYMPCDNNCHDEDFINMLYDVSLLFNHSYVDFGGDMNVDLDELCQTLIF